MQSVANRSGVRRDRAPPRRSVQPCFPMDGPGESRKAPTLPRTGRSDLAVLHQSGERQGLVTLLRDQSRLGEQVLLELGDIVQGRLRILLAGDRKVELILLLGQQFEELRYVPHVLLPIQRRG